MDSRNTPIRFISTAFFRETHHRSMVKEMRVRFYVSYILPLIVLFIFVMGYWNQFRPK